MRGYTVLLAAIFMQICLGGIYAWSTFVPPLTSHYPLSVTQTQWAFGLSIAVFTIAMTYAGRLLLSHGPRRMATIGGALFGIGYIIASLSPGSFGVLLLGIAVISGAGIGFGYISPLSTSVKWFPEHKGLVTGLAVAGFGGGAVLLSSLASMLLTVWDVALVFRWVGVVYGLVIVVSAQFMRLPASVSISQPSQPASSSFATLYTDGQFPFLAWAMFAGTFAGLLVIGNLSPLGLALGVSSVHAVAAVSSFAIGNALGRVTWGWVYDQLGARTLPMAMVVLSVAVFSLAPASHFDTAFVFMASLVGFGFGACFVIFAARVVDIYGLRAMATVYPLVFLFYGASAVFGPVLGGWLFDRTGCYLPGIYLATIVGLVSAGILWKHNTAQP